MIAEKEPIRSLAKGASRTTALNPGLLADLIARLGRDDFDSAFAEAGVNLSTADQITAFSIEGGHARCLLAHRPKHDELAATLCRQYVTHYHERDIFLRQHASTQTALRPHSLALDEISDESYRKRLFAEVGLTSKISAVLQKDERLIYLNFYFGPRTANQLSLVLEELCTYWRLFAELLAKHDVLSGGLFRGRGAKRRVEVLLHERFPVLSDREVEVCARIVTGHKVEGIGLDLGLSTTTVTTFRKRAYAKLGISSQSELFAHCAGVIA